MVAGSTTSAICAVSVMNCSCTQTNRSSRAKPRLTRSWSGATDTGLVFWISSAVDRRAARERVVVAAQDRADARLVEHAHRRVAHVEPFDHRLVPVIDRALLWKAPPPSCSQAPVTAGMQLAACMLTAPLREREKP